MLVQHSAAADTSTPFEPSDGSRFAPHDSVNVDQHGVASPRLSDTGSVLWRGRQPDRQRRTYSGGASTTASFPEAGPPLVGCPRSGEFTCTNPRPETAYQ